MEMGKLEEEGYFEGNFIPVHKYVKIYAYDETLPANKASTSDIHIKFEPIATNKILKPIQRELVQIDVNIMCSNK